MILQIPESVSVIMILLLGVFFGVLIFFTPIFFLGRWFQRKRDPIKRESVSKARISQAKAERKHEILKGRVMFLYNLVLGFLNELIRFMHNTGINPEEKKNEKNADSGHVTN